MSQYENGTDQQQEAATCYTKAFELGLRDSQCRTRLDALTQCIASKKPAETSNMRMRDSQIDFGNYDIHAMDESDLEEFSKIKHQPSPPNYNTASYSKGIKVYLDSQLEYCICEKPEGDNTAHMSS